jgi:predicted RNase H-like HicB family nuclease
MIIEYLNAALKKAEYKKLDDGTWFAEIPGFGGVWANAGNIEDCRHELSEVLDEWLVLKIRTNDEIPAVDGAEIRFSEEKVA